LFTPLSHSSNPASCPSPQKNVPAKLPSRSTILKQFVSSSSANIALFPEHLLNSLDITTRPELDAAFKSAFCDILERKKRRYSFYREKRIQNVHKKKETLWNVLCDRFIRKNPDTPPLRRIVINTVVQGYKDYLSQQWDGFNDVATMQTCIFAKSAEGAKTSMSSLLNYASDVSGGEIIAFGPHEQVFEKMKNLFAGGEIKRENEMLDIAKQRIKEFEDRVDVFKKIEEFQRKKIEMIQFVESLNALMFLNSSNDVDFKLKNNEQNAIKSLQI